LNLPGTTLNGLVGSGNNTLVMGSAGGPGGLPANNSLNALNWAAADINSTGTESVSILDAVVGSMNIQENSGNNDAIQLWGVQTNGSINLVQHNGSVDSIS